MDSRARCRRVSSTPGSSPTPLTTTPTAAKPSRLLRWWERFCQLSCPCIELARVLELPVQAASRTPSAMVCGQLLRRQGRTKIHIPLAYDRQRKRANLRRQPMVAGFAAALRQQTRGAVLAQAVQQPKYLTPAQADQRTRVGNTHSTRLNLQQYLKPAEILLAHRPRRHGTPPETPRSGEVPFELWRGVSSLYGA